MPLKSLAAFTLAACLLAMPAWAQEPIPAETATDAANAGTANDGAQVPQLPPTGRTIPNDVVGSGTPESSNVFKLTAGDFKHFFSTDTAKVMSYIAIVAVATAPWDREGVNNGFNIPTALFEGGNLVGQFVFQTAAGFATYGVAQGLGNKKLALVGRDIVRAQLVSQVMVQALKHSIRRERPDGSNNGAFPSGHSASAFATATILHRHYGWKIGVPAYALGSYVALARMAWNRHHATDVVMGAGFGIASARTVTMAMAKTKFSVGVQPQAGGASVNFTKIYK